MSFLSRIPSTTGGQLMNANLQRSYKRLIELQDQLSSGKQLRVPSDDPAGTLFALDTRTQLRRNQQFQRNISDAQGWLRTADSSLVTAQDYLNRIRDLAIASRSGAMSPTALNANANEIDALRDSLIQLGNASYGNRAIFAGTGNTMTPVQATGQPAAAANSATVMRPVSPGINLQVNTDTTTLFGTWVGTPGGDYNGNLFEVLAKLSSDIRNPGAPGANVAQGITALDGGRDRIANVQATLGARSKRIDDLLARNDQVTGDLTEALTEVEDVDIPKTFIEVRQQQMAYEAALSVTAKVVQPSLVDFLR